MHGGGVILFVSKALPTLLRFDSPHLGRLFTPRHVNAVRRTAEAGVPWAADNDAFSGFDEARFVAMLDLLRDVPGCRFVTAPDVVGDASETWRLFSHWGPRIADEYGLPAGFVLQDGATSRSVPWLAVDAVFIGGSTAWKLSPEAEWLAREAKDRGKWLHMGRVNGMRRLRRAQAWGCDSVDGSSFARFTDTWIPQALNAITHVQPEMI